MSKEWAGVLRVAGYSHVGTRERNEDSWSIVQFPWTKKLRRGEKPVSGTFAAVADGLGGERNGQAASMAAIRSCQTVAFHELLNEEESREKAIGKVFLKAHQAVRRTGGYTTLAALLALPGEPPLIAWAGDSSVWWWRPRKGWERLTTAHGSGNVLTNFLGKNAEMEALTQPFFLEVEQVKEPGIYLVCSDGMHPVLEQGAGTPWAVDRNTLASAAVQLAVSTPWTAAHDNATCIRLEVR